MEFDESEVFIDVEIEFSIDDKDYFWVGSYEVRQYGESPTWYSMGMSEVEVNILGTIRLCMNSGNDWVDIAPTGEILEAIEETIFNDL